MYITQAWGQVHEYLYLSSLKYPFESICTLLSISARVLVLILKYYSEYTYYVLILSIFKYTFESTSTCTLYI